MGGTSADRLTDQTGGLNGDTLGATGGSETHTLTEAQLPAHSHSLGTNGRVQVGNDNGTAYSGKWVSGSGSTITYSTEDTGSDTAHNNVQPTIILNYIIKT
jgi:microcystin-dependent protein